jgi:hypothetical protein
MASDRNPLPATAPGGVPRARARSAHSSLSRSRARTEMGRKARWSRRAGYRPRRNRQRATRFTSLSSRASIRSNSTGPTLTLSLRGIAKRSRSRRVILWALMRSLYLVALAAVALIASSVKAESSAGIPIGPTPRAVTAACKQRAMLGHFPVLCPRSYPLTSQSAVTITTTQFRAPSSYWIETNDAAGFAADDDGHLIFGGQRPTFSLRGAVGQTWPRPGERFPVQQLGIPRLMTIPLQGGGTFAQQRPPRVVAHVTVRAHRGLVLAAPPYPLGGIMGGHVLVLWNEGGHGYLVSLHYGSRSQGHSFSRSQRIEAALTVARSSALVRRHT